LSRANILKEHQQKVHGLESLKRGGRFTCPFHSACTNEPLSDELPSFYHVKDLLEHCSSFHHEQLGKNKQKKIDVYHISIWYHYTIFNTVCRCSGSSIQAVGGVPSVEGKSHAQILTT